MKRAEREASWFFRDLEGTVPDGGDPVTRAAAEQIHAWLRAIPAFHRGALALRYTPRSWPTCVAREFGALASVVVRLECALHPAVGIRTDALEQASVERLRKAIEVCRCARAARRATRRDPPMSRPERDLGRLRWRAGIHVDLAHRALARVRWYGPCLVPGAGPR
ncbi:MAG: hypothetical protein ACLQVI_32180 [Polyangiaceae bacterium]